MNFINYDFFKFIFVFKIVIILSFVFLNKYLWENICIYKDIREKVFKRNFFIRLLCINCY